MEHRRFRLTEAEIPACLQTVPAMRERFSAFDALEVCIVQTVMQWVQA